VLVTKVACNYQIAVPASVTRSIEIREGGMLEVEVDGIGVLIRKLNEERRTLRLGRKLSPEEIERSVEEGNERMRVVIVTNILI